MEVKYVKFYQAVQIGRFQESTLGTKVAKNQGVKMFYESGLLKVSNIDGYKEDVYVPFSNIMCFHAANSVKLNHATDETVTKKPGRPRKEKNENDMDA